MSKFAGPNTKTRPDPAALQAIAPTYTYEGGQGYLKDAKTALFTLAVTDLVKEDTFYETGNERYTRMVDLTRLIAAEDPSWIGKFVPWLRNTAQMRSAPVVIATEYAYVLRDGTNIVGAPTPRSVVDSACSRADEPAELLGYALSTYGRQLPMGFKRGVADAAVRLYNEYSVIKYDGNARGVRMGDVLELTHPTPKNARQSALFKHILNRRHGRQDANDVNVLPVLKATYAIDNVPEDIRTLTKRVQRGAKWLDRNVKRWAQHIDLDKLKLRDAELCVLGQLSKHVNERYCYMTCQEDTGWGVDEDHVQVEFADGCVININTLTMPIEKARKRGFVLTSDDWSDHPTYRKEDRSHSLYGYLNDAWIAQIFIRQQLGV